MLDDMLKIFLDPYFKPKVTEDPDRENLFELIYSPGNTINSKESVNKRREYSWNDLYPTEEAAKEFLSNRLVQKITFCRPKPMKSVNRTPSKDQEVRKSVVVKDDSSIQKFVKPITLSLYSGLSSKPKNEAVKKVKKRDPSPRIQLHKHKHLITM